MCACNAAATEQAIVVKFIPSDAIVDSVVSYTGRTANGNVCTLGINTATVATVAGVFTIVDGISIRSVARDNSARKVQSGCKVSKDAAASSRLVSRDHTACHFEFGIRACYAQATAPATAVAVGDVTALDFDCTLGINHMTVVAQIGSRGNHAALEIEYAARFNVDYILYGTAVRCCIDSAKARNDMPVRSLGGAKSICLGRALSLIVSKTLRSAVIRAASLFPLHTRKLTRRRIGRIDRTWCIYCCLA